MVAWSFFLYGREGAGVDAQVPGPLHHTLWLMNSEPPTKSMSRTGNGRQSTAAFRAEIMSLIGDACGSSG